jgi:hypothetical protein
VRGTHNYAPQHLVAGLEFLAANQSQLPFEKLVSPPFPLERLDDAITLTRQREWQRVSVQP